MSYPRIAIAAIAFSAAAAGVLFQEESWMGTAAIPTKNDRCTNGFGSTFKENGEPVQCGETITPPQAVKRTLGHIAKDETRLKQCVTAPVSQKEYDLLVNHAYQYGAHVTCKSVMVTDINAGNYAKACEGHALYKYSGGFDCSTPGNQVCSGVYKRGLNRKAECLAAQNDTEILTVAPPLPTPSSPMPAPEPRKTWFARFKDWIGV